MLRLPLRVLLRASGMLSLAALHCRRSTRYRLGPLPRPPSCHNDRTPTGNPIPPSFKGVILEYETREKIRQQKDIDLLNLTPE